MTVHQLHLIHSPSELDAPAGTIGATELCHRAGITYRQLDFWTRQGHVHPLPRPRRAGSGWPRYYATDEAAALVLMARLVDDGLQPRPAAAHARQLLEHGHTTIAGITIHLPEDL